MKPNGLVRAISLLMVASATLTAQVARKENAVPLKNWATPLYWQPNQAEREIGQGSNLRAAPQLKFSANAVSPDALVFVAITPCRLVDTRGLGGGFDGIAPFSGPSVAGGGTLTIPVQSTTEASTNTVPAPCGVIPSTAEAYSFNLTVVPAAGGHANYVSLWPAGSAQPFVATLDDPQGAIVSNAAIVPAGTPNGGISIYNAGPASADMIIDMNGYYTAPTDGSFNTALGVGTLGSNTTGAANTAIGDGALQSNNVGSHNTAIGAGALESNTSGATNTATGQGSLHLNTTGSDNTATGYSTLFNNTTGTANTANGSGALDSNTTGNNNSAFGGGALSSNITGSNNTVSGQAAMYNNTTGCCNVAMGQAALNVNTTGNFNVAIGGSALQNSTTAANNSAVGQNALFSNTTGANNTAVGQNALRNNTTGINNVALGQNALASITTANGDTAIGAGALSATTGTQNTAVGTGALANAGINNTAIGWGAGGSIVGNNNIDVGNTGLAGDGTGANIGVIRIGTSGTQTSFFAAGVSGTATGLGNAVPVVIDSNGQLGTVNSSQRFKEDIQDMGDASSALMRLRPVTFRLKQSYADGSKPIDYGLIAEEVAGVYPDLVAYSPSGEVQTVQYQKVNAMLLNEVQKQHRQIQEQSDEMTSLKALLAEMRKQLEVLAASK